jgi:Xaa-Pro aminopeptidase
MRSDIDRLMAERDLKAIVILITESYSAELDILVGQVQMGKGLALKKQGEAPILIAGAMEVEEAAASGLDVYTMNDLGYADLLKEAEGDATKAQVGLWGNVFEKFAVQPGKIGIYGTGSFSFIIAFIPLLQAAYPDYRFSGELGSTTLFDEAVLTKDAQELEQIKSVAERTSAVWQATWDFIGGHRADGQTVVDEDGKPLTIGDVRRFVRRALLDRGLEDTGLIFAQGRDAGFPHSRGQDDRALQLGQAIVFDLFPRELGGGYHHDSTRTWSIGYATEEVQEAYDTVMESFDVALETYGLGKPTRLMQDAVQDYLEGKGHPTQRSHPGTTTGYMHGLGHGVGFNIHESPRISQYSKKDTFEVGNVFTIEPGVYYPDGGYGIRIEDTFYIDDNGELISLTDFHKELVLPLQPD